MKRYIALFLVLFFLPSLSNASERKLKKTMKRLVKKHSLILLAPESVIADSWKNLEIGFKLSHRIRSGKFDLLTESELVRIDSNKYIFDYTVDGEKKNYQTAYINGLKYEYKDGQTKEHYPFQKCIRFKIGKCTYKKSGRKKHLYTSYENGVWKRNWIYTGIAGNATRYTIYDQYGLVIFEWTKYENKLQGDKRLESVERIQ